jgi:hypothetical protein
VAFQASEGVKASRIQIENKSRGVLRVAFSLNNVFTEEAP